MVWLKKASCPKGTFLKMLARFPQCFWSAFYMLPLCYCKTPEVRCCSLVCGRLLVFQWTGQFEWRQWACPSAQLLTACAALPVEELSSSGRESISLSCGSSSMPQRWLRLAAVVFRNTLEQCERQGNQALSAFVKNFESKLFCFSYPAIRALSRKEPLG